MKVTLAEWGKRNYSPAPSLYVLRSWANSGQIIPPPEKVGKSWMVDEKATRMPLPRPDLNGLDGQLSERALRILNNP